MREGAERGERRMALRFQVTPPPGEGKMEQDPGIVAAEDTKIPSSKRLTEDGRGGPK